jgi:hypothetical protein
VIVCVQAKAVRVQESTISEDQVTVILSADEVERSRSSAGANIVGADVATKMLGLAGVPSSVTGKVASIAVWSILCEKYTLDIKRACAKAAEGSSLTLKYHVNLDGVRDVWRASEAADLAAPGGPAVSLLNTSINMLMDMRLD